MKLPWLLPRPRWCPGSLGLFLISLALTVTVACTPPAPPQIPAPDTAGMEGRVRRRIEEARTKVLEAPDSAQAWGTLGMIYDVHELDAAALASYRQARSRDPQDPRWPYFEGRLRAIQGQDLAAAIEALETALKLDPDYAPGHLRLADALAKKGDLDAAETAYHRASELDPTLAKAHLGQGQVLLRQGREAEAIPHLERARELSPEDAAVLFALGQAYQRSGRGEAAREAQDAARNLEIVDGFPDPRLAELSALGASSSLLFERATGYLEAGKPQRALADLKIVASLRPRDPYTQREIAVAYQQLDQGASAIPHLRKALELKPEVVQWRLELAETLLRSQDAEGAVRELLRARQDGLESLHLKALLGSARARSGDLAGADREFAAAPLEALPAQALFDWGNALAQMGRLPEAEQRFRRALESDPDLAPAHLSLGLSLEAQHRPKEAIPHYRRALELARIPLAAQRLQALGVR